MKDVTVSVAPDLTNPPNWVEQLGDEIKRVESAVAAGDVDVDEAIATLQRVSREIQTRLNAVDQGADREPHHN